jgi:hypothetical protein
VAGRLKKNREKETKMKKTVTIIVMGLIGLIGLSSQVSADVLVGWDFETDSNRDQPSYTSAAISTNSILNNYNFDGKKGSTDGTWGNSTETPAPATSLKRSTKFKAGDGALIQDLTILVKDGAEVSLSSLNFDYFIPNTSSPNDFTLSYLSGDLGAGGVTLFSFADSGLVTTMTGVDVDLTTSAMTDLTLSGGQSATFRFDFTDDPAQTGASFVDNIGVLGTVDVIPEPATMGLMAFLGSTILFIRRRMIL